MNLPKGKVLRGVNNALKLWDHPSRKGLDVFRQMKVAQKYGFNERVAIIEGRIAINNMLSAYINQLARLQPLLAQLLFRRFKHKQTIKQVAFDMHLSVEQINRLQKQAIIFIADLIYDDETRRP